MARRRGRRLRRKGLILVMALLLAVYSMLSMWIATKHLDHGRTNHKDTLEAFEGRDENKFAACMLVMDDSHFLTEWIAYHYHAVNLRTIVLAIDPKSQTSPSHVLDRWKDASSSPSRQTKGRHLNRGS